MVLANRQDQNVPESGTYEIDAAASTVRFRTRTVFGLFPVRGTFGISRGRITVADPVEESSVDVTVRTDSFDSGLQRRDRHIASADYLDAAKHPEIEFRGRGVTESATDTAVLQGELTVRGVTRPLAVSVGSVVLNGRRVTVEGTAIVDRYAFGVTTAKGMTGRRMKIRLAVEAVAG
ncbi:YceI family protein [Streptomyces sp. BA2]|uniref:YceI family protein n=1 Tax=Streptomyces sp. BA2 TaxID=436595 RepID=UPI001329A6EF|nr:YceI family protein [Streptomyces sp. BA2]MWA08946.1 YceI family protein [Streptomyces sp. BA2]